MILEGEAAIPLETTRRAFLNQEKSKQRSAIVQNYLIEVSICLVSYHIYTRVQKFNHTSYSLLNKPPFPGKWISGRNCQTLTRFFV